MTIPLAADRIAAHLADHAAHSPAAIRAVLEIVAETGSTNADLLARVPTLAGPVLRAAEHQNAGRGRAGRTWHSEPGAALMFSLAWPFARPLAGLVGLPLAVGVTLARTLAAFGIDARLKWPNDILQDGDKLAGVLIETAGGGRDDADRPRIWAVIGVGINVALPASLRATIDRPVGQMHAGIDRNALLARLWPALETALARFEEDGFAPFMDDWNALHAYRGQTVNILDAGKILHAGTATGVDSTGRLLLDTAGALVRVMAGDVSLRLAETA
jgi:BirA family biotin operon repressor/biotin-[acetyl-CoA-carboxylase] ligase